MTRSQNTKRALVFSVISLMLCLSLLLGTTFAWFTDSVTNSGNQIQAGTLSITATVANVDTNKDTFTIPEVNGGKSFGFQDPRDLEDANDPIISETSWEPGKSNAKLLTVTNNGDLAAKIKLQFDITVADLQNALWFDFVQVNDKNEVTGQFTPKSMSDINTVAQSLEIPVGAKNSVSFILVYGMNENAGNEYQGKSFSADVTILATQYTYEEDGFGSNQYDADAAYKQVDVTATDNAADNGNKVEEAIAKAEDGTVISLSAGEYQVNAIALGDKDITIMGNSDVVITPVGNASSDNGGIVISGSQDASLTVENVTFVGKGETGSRGVCFSGQGNSNATLVVKNSTFESLNTGIYLGGVTNATITGCTFTDCTAGIGGTEDVTGTLTVNGCTFSGGAETIGWAGEGTLVIKDCTGCDTFKDYNLDPNGQAVSVSDGTFTYQSPANP